MKKKYRVIKWRKTLPRSKIISYFDNIQLLIPMLRRVLSKSNNKYFSLIKYQVASTFAGEGTVKNKAEIDYIFMNNKI